MQAWTATRDVNVRGPLAPGPAVAERRTDDVLPAGQVVHRHGAGAWTGALIASVARTGWIAAVTTLAFLGGAFGATVANGRSASAAVPWVLIGAGLWLLIAVTWTLLRRR
jgi:hypothetical protein